MKNNKPVEILIPFFLFILMLILNVNIWTSLGLGMSALFFIRFFNNIGNSIDFRDFLLVIPLLQWVIGPFLSYRYVTDDTYYYMAIKEPEYMSFAVPALIFFAIGLYIPIFKKTINLDYVLFEIKKKITRYKNIDLILIISGIFFYSIKGVLPIQFNFLAFLLGNLRYVGLLFLLLNDRKNKKVIFFSVLFFAFVMSLRTAMFHLMIIWFTFLFVIVAFVNKYSLLKKTIILLFLFIGLIVIQTVKHEFRQMLYSGKASSTLTTFGELVSQKVDSEGAFTSEANVNNMISRINQGWIIARVMNHVPKYEPYANGETIIEALKSTLLPRFLSLEKKKSGGRETFIRFTGRNLESTTSMNISILGEAYANYGKDGIIFMFVFGLFLNISYSAFLRKMRKTPTLLFFIPIIYLQVIKAETDFVTVLNHLVKASIFVWLIYWGLEKFLNIKL